LYIGKLNSYTPKLKWQNNFYYKQENKKNFQ